MNQLNAYRASLIVNIFSKISLNFIMRKLIGILLILKIIAMDNRYESIKQRSFKERKVFLVFLNT